MSVQNSVPDVIHVLRARAERYKRLAESACDWRMAEEVAGFATELEAEVLRLEQGQCFMIGRNLGRPALAS